MLQNILFTIAAIAMIVIIYILLDSILKIFIKYDDKYIEKRKKEQEEYFKKQKNMGYNGWKNPHNTAPNGEKDNFPECLKILGFSSWPKDLSEIRNNYRKLAKEKHPDIGGSTEEFEKINKAYQEAQNLRQYKR